MRQEIGGREFILNSRGGFDPIEIVSPLDQLRDETVEDVMRQALELKADAEEKRRKIWEKITAFLSLSAENYGVQWGGVKGNVSLVSYDGLSMVQVSIGEYKAVNEGIHSAKKLVDDVLTDLTGEEGVPPALRAIVNNFFQVNHEGKLDFRLLSQMKRWEIDDVRWVAAMVAIDKSIEVIGSSKYLRFYTRSNVDAKWQMISMDFSKLGSDSAKGNV